MHDIYIFINLLSLCLPVVISTEEDLVFRVVNGKAARIGEIPYQVALKHLQKNTNDAYFTSCGGAILGEKKVLTAAHCVTETNTNTCQRICCCMPYKLKKLEDINVVAATLRNEGRYPTNTNSTEQWRKVSKLIIPSGYKFPKRDIALIITSTPFEFNRYVSSLPFATKGMDYGSMRCLASGYGRISQYSKSSILLWAYLELIPSNQCSRLHKQRMARFVCTRSDYTDVLQGDSGGPLVCNGTGDPADSGKGVIVGVVSGSRSGSGTFFTRVSSYKEFIESEAVTELPCTLVVFFTWLLRTLYGHG